MAEVFLISENTVRSISNMDDNVQSKFLQSAIREAQMDYEEVIGTKLINKLKDLVSTRHIDDSGNTIYKELLDNSRFYLAYNALKKCIVMTTVKISNVGAFTSNDDNVESIGLKDAFSLEDYYTRKTDYYLSRLQRYILSKKEKFPELRQWERFAIKSELWSAYSGGLWLGGRRGKVGYYPKYNSYGYDKPFRRR